MRIVFAAAFLIALVVSQTATAQAVRCGIWYEYDAVGNRVLRYYDCREETNEPENPSGRGMRRAASVASGPSKTADGLAKDVLNKTPKAQAVTVYPNPTVEAFHIDLQWTPDQPLHFHWYDAQGRIVGSGTFSGPSYQGKMGAWTDGSYWLHLYEGAQTIGSWKIIKSTSR
ncbi:MAG: T9SS type A sorting domain-containing protein [Sphingobacteriales bacterium]|nr:MAG: T9SS type A sorting domain-containing protein [Sphingobacteriales bacterium]